MADMIRTVLVEQKMIYEERIAELIKERDEARREVLEQIHPDLRWAYAAARDWDYLKENTNA